MGDASDDLLQRIATEVVDAHGCDLEEVSVRGHGRHRRVVVVVDADGGVALDRAAEISRRLSAALDEAGDPVGGGAPYTLEVTSRGVDRPLTLPRHYRRAVGRLIRLTTTGDRREKVRIAAVSEEGLTVLGGPHGLTETLVAWPDILQAVIEVEFSTPSAAVRSRLAEIAAHGDARDDAATATVAPAGEGGTQR